MADYTPDFPRLDTPLRALQRDYRFCTRCWLPLAPVRRCTCAPSPDAAPAETEPTPAQIAATVAQHPALHEMAQAVAHGRYAGDTATWEQRALGFWRWLYDHQRVGEHSVWTYELVDEGDVDASR